MNSKTNSYQKDHISTDLSDETRSFQDRIDEVRRLVEENLRYSKNFSQLSEVSESGQHSQLRQLVEENLKATRELQAKVEKINRWVVWQRIFGVIKIVLIVIPLVLGLIYLPALLKQAVSPYQDLLRLKSPGVSDQSGLLDQLNKYLDANQEPAQ